MTSEKASGESEDIVINNSEPLCKINVEEELAVFVDSVVYGGKCQQYGVENKYAQSFCYFLFVVFLFPKWELHQQ